MLSVVLTAPVLTILWNPGLQGTDNLARKSFTYGVHHYNKEKEAQDNWSSPTREAFIKGADRLYENNAV